MVHYLQDACCIIFCNQDVPHETQANEKTPLLGIGLLLCLRKFIGLVDGGEKLPQEWLYHQFFNSESIKIIYNSLAEEYSLHSRFDDDLATSVKKIIKVCIQSKLDNIIKHIYSLFIIGLSWRSLWIASDSIIQIRVKTREQCGFIN
jgi:hypothetical protein